jgi:hypothetical protein
MEIMSVPQAAAKEEARQGPRGAVVALEGTDVVRHRPAGGLNRVHEIAVSSTQQKRTNGDHGRTPRWVRACAITSQVYTAYSYGARRVGLFLWGGHSRA